MDKLGDLSDEQLLARLRGHVGKGNVWCAELVAYLIEVEERRLDRVHACSSMWDFCTRKLGMSEGEAHRRIAAARTVRRFPQVLGYIERGELHLCALYALRRHLTSDSVDELLRETSGKSTREVEKMVAARFPRPDLRASVEPVAPQALLSPLLPAPVSVAMPSDAAPAWPLSPMSGPRPRVEPLSATRYRIELTVTTTTKETIDRIKDLMRHRNPTGDLETILDTSLALLLAQLEKERLGKAPRPRKRRPVEATNACASSAPSAPTLGGVATRAPTAPIPLGPTADAPAAPVPPQAGTHEPDELAHLEATVAGDPAAIMPPQAGTHEPEGSPRLEAMVTDLAAATMPPEARTHEPEGLARLEATVAGDPATTIPLEARTRAPHGLARAEATADDRGGIPVRSNARTQSPGPNADADTNADAVSRNRNVRAPGPSNAEPNKAGPIHVDALLGVEATAAARTMWPTASKPATKASRRASRYVPTELRRQVFARDGEQCTYVGPDGDRCPARGYLELDHIRPKAHGGTETAANLRVRCRAHNALYAEQVFGRAHVAGRMDLRRRKCAPSPPAAFETVARGLRSMGFREPEARRALETLATKRDMEAAPLETILREALLVLT